VASGDTEAVREAYQQGIAVTFPLRCIGPHVRRQDAVSRKTPLHLVPHAPPSDLPLFAPLKLLCLVAEGTHRGAAHNREVLPSANTCSATPHSPGRAAQKSRVRRLDLLL